MAHWGLKADAASFTDVFDPLLFVEPTPLSGYGEVSYDSLVIATSGAESHEAQRSSPDSVSSWLLQSNHFAGSVLDRVGNHRWCHARFAFIERTSEQRSRTGAGNCTNADRESGGRPGSGTRQSGGQSCGPGRSGRRAARDQAKSCGASGDSAAPTDSAFARQHEGETQSRSTSRWRYSCR